MYEKKKKKWRAACGYGDLFMARVGGQRVLYVGHKSAPLIQLIYSSEVIECRFFHEMVNLCCTLLFLLGRTTTDDYVGVGRWREG